MASNPKPSVSKCVNLCVQKNNTEHHTDEISKECLVVRRGQPFGINIQLKEKFNSKNQNLTLTFETGGEHAYEELGTKVVCTIPKPADQSSSDKLMWKAKIMKSTPPNNSLVLTIAARPTAPIGKYVCSIKHKDDVYDWELYLLYNPWCPADSVFMPNDEERTEYVLNEHGLIYYGTSNYISDMEWDFGQFEDDMLDICFKLLEINKTFLEDPAHAVASRCDPIYTSRMISGMVNAQDDCGVLVGRWDGSYEDGYNPCHWTGSHSILHKWYSTGQPVRYGQCWVFGAVMCSVMRLLGIPCRVITNFSSAHDCNESLTIDTYYCDDGVAPKDSHDSVWNFHVWNEVYLTRRDLSESGEFNEWQVVDSTPQETSDGRFCCGPASVQAIFLGLPTLNYDTGFTFAEVNADCSDYWINSDGTKEIMTTDTKRVGKNISTKKVGCNERNDITNNYKHKEGTEEERIVFRRAFLKEFRCDGSEPIVDDEESDKEDDLLEKEEMEEEPQNAGGDEKMEVEVEERPSDIPPKPELFLQFKEVTTPTDGKDVSLKLILSSECKTQHTLSVHISVQAMHYNGIPDCCLKQYNEEIKMKKKRSMHILVPYSVYHKPMVNCENMKILAEVKDKKKPKHKYMAEFDVVLMKPPISMKLTSEAKLRKVTTAEMIFVNPVQEALTKCKVTFSGCGLIKDEEGCCLPDLPPNSKIRIKVSFYPYKTGERTLMGDFDCSDFKDVKASCTVNVKS
ncbi:protein-glutamine gamma-glutamyltransferase 5-like [Pholidichthys leucotaenia]